MTGTAAQHAATFALKGDDLDVRMSGHGALDVPRDAAGAISMAALAWKGTIDTLENQGPWTLHLAAPAAVEVARTRIHVGATRLDIADGNVQLTDFAWDDGRIATSGSFKAVPLATLARLARTTLPFQSTVTLGGEWSLAAAPRLSGTLVAATRGRRPRVRPDRDGGRDDRRGHRDARGAGTIHRRCARRDGIVPVEPRRQGRGEAHHRRRGGRSSRAHCARGAVSNFSANGDIPSLAFLQPWIGSVAVVSGRVHLDVAARGTVAEAALSGAVVGEGLRIDAPQYGLHFTNGRLAARAANDRIVVDDLTLGAGAGTFHASGEVSGLTPGGAKPVAKLAWQAEKFRVFNRPDLHLVVEGDGTVVAENGRINLAGKLRADEGSIVYLATPDSTLGDDVVVKGWDRTSANRMRVDDLPLNRRPHVRPGRPAHVLGRRHRDPARRRGARDDRAERVHGQGHDPHGARHVLRVRAAAHDRSRPARVRRPPRQSRPRHRRAAQEPRRRGRGCRHRDREGAGHPAHVESAGAGQREAVLARAGAEAPPAGGDLAALQAASAALLGAHGKPVSASIAQSIGLDNITFKSAERSTQPGTPGAENQVVAVGKRISDRLSLVYEQGLTLATNTLRLEYELTRSLTLRAEAGTYGALGIYFRRTFD